MYIRCCLLGLSLPWFLLASAVASETYRLEEKFPAGYQYHVSSRVDLTGTLQLPSQGKDAGKTLTIAGTASVEYDERILTGETVAVPATRTLRNYDRLDFRRKIGDQLQESSLRPEVRRMVILRLEQTEVPFSPDGPLMWSEIDRVRTDVFVPALRGLLPEKPVRVGDQWAAAKSAVQELTDLDEITAGQIQCRLQDVQMRNGSRVARVRLSGSVQGINEDGPNRQDLEGYFLFDLDRRFLTAIYLDGTSWLVDKDNKPQGRVDGRFSLTRQVEISQALSDDRIRGLVTEPNDDNTLLLFREPALGVEFVYARRWTVKKADARQILLDEPQGGGIAITLEPLSQTPTGTDFLAEARKTLAKHGVKVTRERPLRSLNHPVGSLEEFAFEGEIEKQSWTFFYMVNRQRFGGATFMGRWPTKLDAELAPEARRIAQSLKLIPPKK